MPRPALGNPAKLRHPAPALWYPSRQPLCTTGLRMNLKTIKYIGRGISLAIAIVLVFGYYAVSQCANTPIIEKASPSGSWKIILFERSCGSLTGKSSQISLIESNQALQNTSGNIYVAEGYPEGYEIEWLSDTSVKVSGVKGENHLKVTEHEGISVIYE